MVSLENLCDGLDKSKETAAGVVGARCDSGEVGKGRGP